MAQPSASRMPRVTSRDERRVVVCRRSAAAVRPACRTRGATPLAGHSMSSDRSPTFLRPDATPRLTCEITWKVRWPAHAARRRRRRAVLVRLPDGAPCRPRRRLPSMAYPTSSRAASRAARLNRLAATFQCAWCTGWEERAEEHLPRLLGLPGGWPHLTFRRRRRPPARHWKLGAIESRAGPERAARVDRRRLRRELRGVGGRAARPRRCWCAPSPRPGLLTEHVTLLESWARAPVSRSTGTSGRRNSRSGSPAVPRPAET